MAADIGAVGRAAELARTDLLTQMVGEFPELQGRMGYYYALHDGEPEEVAIAIEEQYLPRHAGDSLPASPSARRLALPTGSIRWPGFSSLANVPAAIRIRLVYAVRHWACCVYSSSAG